MGTVFTFMLFGYPVAVTGSALLMFAFLVYGDGGRLADLSQGLIWATMLFLSILVHELGHAFVGDRLGLRPRGIVLHGFGGLCQYGRSPTAREGLLSSAAGPAAGLLLAGLAFALHLGLSGRVPYGVTLLTSSLWTISLVLNLLNLVPMYPLDGGHILHNFLSLWLRGSTAWTVTKWVSVAIAVVLIPIGLFTGMRFLAFIAAISLYQTLTR